MRLDRPLVVLDVETTSVDISTARIIEIGVSVLNPDGVVKPKRWSRRINPGIPIPAESTAIHGITDADVAECKMFDYYAPRIHAFIDGKHLAGYNLWRLDLPVLDEEFRRYGVKLDLTGVHVIDVAGIFFKKEPRNLEAAVQKYCGRAHDGAHNAGTDADATLEVLLAQLKTYKDLSVMDTGVLAEWSRISENKVADLAGKLFFDKDGDLCFAFGKYRNEKVRLHFDFAQWMLSKDFPASTREYLMAEMEKEEARDVR
jgi:DNA polymerase III subunit epsilon